MQEFYIIILTICIFLLTVITFRYIKHTMKWGNIKTYTFILCMLLILSGLTIYNIFEADDYFYIVKIFWNVYLLFILSCHDIDKKLLPVRILSLGIFISIIFMFFEPQSRAFELVLTGIFMGGLILLISYISKGGVGRGDAIVFLIIGFMHGAEKSILLFLVTIFITGLLGIVLFVIKKANRRMELPLVPFILLATLITEFL